MLSIKVCAGQVQISGDPEWIKAVLIMDGSDCLVAVQYDGSVVDEDDLDDFEELESNGCFNLPKED